MHPSRTRRSGRFNLLPTLLLPAVLGAGLLSGCGSTVTDSNSTALTDPVMFTADALPAAFTGEALSADVSVRGGAGPYSYRVVSGTLPPGITLSGSTLSGKPTAAGAYRFSLEASDSKLSTRVKEYTLNVGNLPPLSLEPELPSGEIRGETRVPLGIKGPRNVRAARLVWELDKGVTVSKVQATDPSTLLFWRQDGQTLTLDMGFRNVPRGNGRVALITVKPSAPVMLSASKLWYESRDNKGVLLSEKKKPGAASTPAPATPATDPKATDAKITDTKTTDSKPSDTKAADTKAADPKATDSKVTNTQTTDSQTTDSKPTDSTSTTATQPATPALVPNPPKTPTDSGQPGSGK